MALTPSGINALRPAPKPYKVFDGGGLYIAVRPSGIKAWRLKYRFAGREKNLTFGRFPDVSIAEARARTSWARGKLAEGVDPGLLNKEGKIARRRAEAAKADSLAIEETMQRQRAKFSLSNEGAISFRLGRRLVSLTPAETAELLGFLDATRNLITEVTSCP